MKTLLQLRYGECRYPTGDSPFFFCGAITAHEATSYCAVHHRICHQGYGKDPRAIEEMIYGIENTVVRRRPSEDATKAVPVDEGMK